VSLALDADQEGGNVDLLLSDANVSLGDKVAGVVNGFGEPGLVHEGLEAALKEVLKPHTKDEIELVLGLVEDTEAVKAAEESSTLEQSLGMVLLELEELTGGLSHLSQSVVNSPHLTLVLEAILSHNLELRIQAILLEGILGRARRLAALDFHHWEMAADWRRMRCSCILSV